MKTTGGSRSGCFRSFSNESSQRKRGSSLSGLVIVADGLHPLPHETDEGHDAIVVDAPSNVALGQPVIDGPSIHAGPRGFCYATRSECGHFPVARQLHGDRVI